MESDLTITILTALLAGLSFIAFAWPFLIRNEKKERYKDMIAKRRKTLFEEARKKEIIQHPDQVDKTISARESLALFFKVQKLAGGMGDDLRDKLLQAGYRNPDAPLKFMIATLVLPFFFMGIGMLFISGADKEIPNFVVLLILFGAATFGFYLPKILVKNQALKRSEEIGLSFPDALDMMLICVQGGIGLEQAVQRVAEEVIELSETLAEELGILSAEMSMLNDRRAALQDFARRVGSPSARSFATALIQAEQYGTSIAHALRVISEDLRDQRMAAAEQKAAALPPKLTVPMITFFLPVLFIVIMGPVAIQIRDM